MDELPLPFTLNPFKHHIEWYRWLRNRNISCLEEYLGYYFQKGNNRMSDYYYGKLDINQVMTEVKSILKNKGCWERERYMDWINSSPGKFRILRLSDNSNWTLLCGDNRYVHIHPARNSQCTIRIRMLTLKTIMLYGWLYSDVLNISAVNKIRGQYLNASPIKHLGHHMIHSFNQVHSHL